MTQVDERAGEGTIQIIREVPAPVLWVLRGIGQVFFQENALTGALFLLGIALSSPTMAAGALVGAVIGTAVAFALKFDRGEIVAGIHGFNPTLVGIAALFLFRPGAMSITLLIVGCVVATILTRLARGHLPFPTYTAPFIVTTWALFLIEGALGLPRVEHGGPPAGVGPLVATAHGVSQVMFQANLWTGLLFLAGIAVSDWEHALLVLIGSAVGMLLRSEVAASARALDPESLVERTVMENVALGLYGYNATLAPVALFLARRSLVAPMLGIFLAVALTGFFPLIGVPALTAPFVLATWIVLALAAIERTRLQPAVPPPTHREEPLR